jgi:hypothetical protein
MTTELATLNELKARAIVAVASTAERDAFGIPPLGARVHNLETGYIERFNGTAWVVVPPADLVADISALEAALAAATYAGLLTAARLKLTDAIAKIVGGATSLALRNAADDADNLLLTDAGVATFRGLVTTPAGGGAATLRAAGVVSSQFSAVGVGNVGAGEDDLMSYVLPANTLNVNGRAVRIRAWGKFAANTNSKTLKTYWGSTASTVIATTDNTINGWSVEVIVVRVGANSQSKNVEASFGPALGAGGFVVTSAPSENETAALTIKFTGTGVADADITQWGMTVEVLN